MESKKFINDVEIWVKMRLLRNKIAHAYIPEEREKIYKDIIKHSKEIFGTIDVINEFLITEKLI